MGRKGSTLLSVVIPTLDAERTLAATLAALVPAAIEGLVREVVIADGGSRDQTLAIADAAGCTIVDAPKGRGTQLAAGARAAKCDWLLFLHADTVLDEDWAKAARRFIAAEAGGGKKAAAFRFALDADGAAARLLERFVALRGHLFAMPYGDQGLLISRGLYDALGGFAPLEIMEDVDMVRRIGRRRLRMLPARAVTGAQRYRRHGIFLRGARNLACLSLYFLRVPPRIIARLYG
jgi:rSAM/selenodomain-associated transferase 2